jgi:ABC-type thiamin/hydroxymethylpyrimidine transport system permease subunit
MQHTSRIAHTTGVHRHVDDLLFDLGGVTGVGVIQKEGTSLTQSVLAAIASLALARCAMSNDIGTLAVGAVQDLEDHRVTRLRWGLLWLSYTPRA